MTKDALLQTYVSKRSENVVRHPKLIPSTMDYRWVFNFKQEHLAKQMMFKMERPNRYAMETAITPAIKKLIAKIGHARLPFCYVSDIF